MLLEYPYLYGYWCWYRYDNYTDIVTKYLHIRYTWYRYLYHRYNRPHTNTDTRLRFILILLKYWYQNRLEPDTNTLHWWNTRLTWKPFLQPPPPTTLLKNLRSCKFAGCPDYFPQTTTTALLIQLCYDLIVSGLVSCIRSITPMVIRKLGLVFVYLHLVVGGWWMQSIITTTPVVS